MGLSGKNQNTIITGMHTVMAMEGGTAMATVLIKLMAAMVTGMATMGMVTHPRRRRKASADSIKILWRNQCRRLRKSNGVLRWMPGAPPFVKEQRSCGDIVTFLCFSCAGIL